MSSAQNRRSIRGRTVLCKLSWVIEVQGIVSVDVFSFTRKFLKQLSLRKETVSVA